MENVKAAATEKWGRLVLASATVANWSPYWPPILHKRREKGVGADHLPETF